MSDVVRSLIYDDEGDPVLILSPKIKRSKPVKFAIPLKDIWMYSEEHNPFYLTAIATVSGTICDMFDIGIPTVQKVSMIADAIQYGIDDLVKMPPQQTEDPKSIGEGKMTNRITDETIHFDVTEDMA
jgi:hypothetical protein